MPIASFIRRIAIVAAVGARLSLPAYADEAPVWPRDQQERLRAVEADVIDVQRKLSVARRKEDLQAVDVLAARFKTLQLERRDLIRATENQLPSE